MNIIEVKNLSKYFKLPDERIDSVRESLTSLLKKRSYKKFTALKSVNFKVRKGEFFGIIGRNGSGKSTLLKVLAGIYPPDRGNIKIRGKISPFLELGVGFNSELTARENVFLNGMVLGLSRRELARKYAAIVRFSGLKKFMETKLKNFSSGMQVRLAFSVAIQASADIFLIDEVLAVGDEEFQEKCFAIFRKLKREGKTVIFVSHGLDTIAEFCDKVAILNKGNILYSARPAKAIMYYQYLMNKKNEATEAVNIPGAKAKKTTKSFNRWGSGEVVINKIELIGSDGPTDIIETGENVQVKISYANPGRKKTANFGIGFYSESDFYCFGVNTLMDRQKIKIKNKGVLILRISKIPLLRGRYYCNAVVFGDIENKAYDWIGQVLVFKVVTKYRYRGHFLLGYKWDSK